MKEQKNNVQTLEQQIEAVNEAIKELKYQQMEILKLLIFFKKHSFFSLYIV